MTDFLVFVLALLARRDIDRLIRWCDALGLDLASPAVREAIVAHGRVG